MDSLGQLGLNTANRAAVRGRKAMTADWLLGWFGSGPA